MAAEGEKLPLGMAPAVPAGREIPSEPPDVGARALTVGARLLAGATTFFFLAFVFAYFYLRSLNQEHMWRPAHKSLDPNQALGGAMVACVIVSALLTILASWQARRGARAWTASAAGALVLGLAAIALQCIEYTVQHFGPTDGAYASVFCVWTALYMIAVLATMYWLETQVATEVRIRRRPAEARAGPDITEPGRLIAPGLDAATFYWTYLAAIGVVTYVVLYLL